MSDPKKWVRVPWVRDPRPYYDLTEISEFDRKLYGDCTGCGDPIIPGTRLLLEPSGETLCTFCLDRLEKPVYWGWELLEGLKDNEHPPSL